MKSPEHNALYPMLETLARLAQPASLPVMDQGALSRLRAELRQKLLALRGELGGFLLEQDCYLTMFPLVLSLDELIQTRHASAETSWPLLQQEFFNVDQGGALFYSTLDELMAAARTTSIVYEVFYFCLNVGFRGRLSGDEDAVESLMKRLRSKLDLPPVALAEETADCAAAGVLKPTRSHWWLYLAAVLLLTLTYLLRRSAASDPLLPPVG